MPEGDTVWAAAKRLHRALAGKTLNRTDFRVPRYATLDLTGSTVTEVLPRGKHLLIRVGELDASDAVTIHSHLKMEGTWHVYAPDAKWRKPGFTARVVLGNESATAVGFSLGILEVLARNDEGRAVGHLGPDVLGPDWDAEEAVRRLRSRPERAIGLALLDQRNLAGLGNVYRNEVCFLAGIHPGAAVEEVPRLERMVDTAQRLLHVNRDRRVRTTTGLAAARVPDGMWVYRRGRQPCRRCGTLIQYGRLGDASTIARDIYFCPFCQKPSGSGKLDTSGTE